MAFTDRERELIRRLEEEMDRGPGARRRRLSEIWWRNGRLIDWALLLGGLTVMVLALSTSVLLSFVGGSAAAVGAHGRLRRVERGAVARRLSGLWRRLGIDDV
jgi:hypothetical protein